MEQDIKTRALLLAKYLTENLSPEEEQAFNDWRKNDPQAIELLKRFSEPEFLATHLTVQSDITEERIQRAKERLQAQLFGNQKVEEEQAYKISSRAAWLRRLVAAAVILSLTIVAYYSFTRKSPEIVKTENVKPLPGSDKAILILANRKRIVLDSSTNNSQIAGNNILTIDTKKGMVVYGDAAIAKGGKPLLNTLQTPTGAQYKLQLDDGSLLFLNAASSVTYPSAFMGDTREISVTGEVYLEVAKNKAKPFIVHVPGRFDVQVLGTSFAVNAYENEVVSKATLVEGSIRLMTLLSKDTVLLTPGHQARIDHENHPFVQEAAAEEANAFTKGYFYFSEGTDIKAVARQLSRWYNIEVAYEGIIPLQPIKGKIERSLPLADVIEILKDMGVKVEYKNNKLTIRS